MLRAVIDVIMTQVEIAKNTHKQEMLRKSRATNWKIYANTA